MTQNLELQTHITLAEHLFPMAKQNPISLSHHPFPRVPNPHPTPSTVVTQIKDSPQPKHSAGHASVVSHAAIPPSVARAAMGGGVGEALEETRVYGREGEETSPHPPLERRWLAGRRSLWEPIPSVCEGKRERRQG